MAFVQGQLGSVDIKLKEVEFKTIIGDGEEMDLIWNELLDFIKKGSILGDRQYWYSYFRWFTDLAWRRLGMLSENDFLDIAIARQTVMALLLEFDVWDCIIRYFTWVTITKEELKILYTKTKAAFFSSKQIVGTYQGKQATVSDLVKEITALNARGNNSLETAEFSTRLKSMLFPKDEPLIAYLTPNQDDAVGRFIDLVHFFLGIEPDKIEYIVDTFAFPEKYVEADETPIVVAPPIATVPNIIEKKIIFPNAVPEAKKKTNVHPAIVAVKHTSQQIKDMLNAQFKKDVDGQFIDIAGALAKLQEIADKEGDPSIADLYYYDEKKGKFVWS